MWKIWLFFSVFKFSFSAPVETKKGSVAAGDLGGLRCLLLSSPIQTCEDLKRYGNDIPKRLQKLYDKVKKPFMEVKNEEILDTASMEIIPTSLLYLIPRVRLGNMSGSAAGKLIRQSPDDEALAIKLSSLLATDDDRQAFLEVLAPDYDSPSSPLSEGVEREIGRALAYWYPVAGEWQYWHFDIALMAGSPVLAHLPSHFLNRMSPAVAEKFVFHLRNWRSEFENNSMVWSSHSTQIKRMWTHTTLKKSALFPAVVKYASYLFLGATPEDISLITTLILDSTQIEPLLDLPWSAVQTRALYDNVHSSHPHYSDATSFRHLLANILPRQIQQFDAATTDLAIVDGGSLPTRAQLLQHKIAYLVSQKKIDYSPTSWKQNIELFGKLINALPASSLEVFKTLQLPMAVVNKVASSSLTYRQMRYLTGNSSLISFENVESIVGSKNHLKALPTAVLNKEHRGKIPENVQKHLLRNIPAGNQALAAILIEQTHLDIDDRPYLTALLENENYDQLLKFLSIRMTSPRMLSWAESLMSIAKENPSLKNKIRALPANIGTMLLATYRQTIALENGWTMENLIENPKNPLIPLLISNFQCIDMDLVNDVDVLPIVGFYVREKKTLGQTFPKNMQYCCQKALTRYLKLKSSLRQWSDDSAGLMNLLEIFEVRAIGGYILASLPLDVIQSAHVKNQISKEIGALPLTELMTATSVANLKVLANFFGKNILEFHLRDLTELGNLIWFLAPEHARRIDVHHFKLWLETFESSQPRAPCFNMQEREFWRDLIINSLGKPSSWSSGTLSLLGDLLHVFEEEDLEAVGAAARTEAGDVMPKYSTFHVKVEWPGKLAPITYYEACIESLPESERQPYKTSVRTLMRFYLESAQMLVQTVIKAETLLRLDAELEENNMAGEVEDSQENVVPTENGRIKRFISSKRGRIFKRVLNEDKQSSAEAKKSELLRNGTRSQVVVETHVHHNQVRISETFPTKSLQVGCDAIRLLGMPASFVLDGEDFDKMTDSELEDCAEVLGALDLAHDVKGKIWPRLTKWKESNNLLEMGNLVSVIPEDEVNNLSFDVSKPWSLESLSVLSQHVTHDETLSLLADRFILSNPDIQSGLRFGPAAALGRIMCQITQSRQQKLLNYPNLFVQLAPLLGSADLDLYCIRHMIGYAKTAYGEVSKWTAEDVAALGVLVAGLDKSDWHKELKAEALAGVTPAAVSRIPPELFKELSEEQLSHLPALSIAAISPAQSLGLSPAQSEVVDRVKRQIPDKDLRASKHSNSARSVLPSTLLTCLAVFASVVKFVF